MKTLPRTTPAVAGSFALLLLMVCADVAHATRDLIVAQPTTHNVLRFDGITGAPKGAFIAVAAGGLDSPTQMILGPDGKLYIADSVASVVKRFDLDGNFIDNFTPAGHLSAPVSLKFGPDGKLYVLCGGTVRQIHRFNGTTGAHEGIAVDAISTRMSSQADFMFMPSTNDFLVVNPGSLNRVSRFNFTTGAFFSFYINSSGNTLILSAPSSMIIGPDGNYWVASSGGINKITRFSITTGAKINDAFLGVSATLGHHEQQYENGYLYVANGSGNNIIAYDAYAYPPLAVAPTGNGPLPAPTSTGDGFEFIAAGTQGLTNPKNILFLNINDPPLANAGFDATVGIGQQFSLNGTGSSDPEGVALSYTWTQLSGPPVLLGPLVVSGSATTAALGILAPDAPVPLVFQLTVSDGVRTATDTVTVQVTAPPTETWRYQYFTSIHNTGDAADLADPDHDDLVNLLERAFDLNPTQPGRPILIADTGTTGLPLIRATEGLGGRTFTLQYLRRKASANSGLTYTPQFGSSMAESGPDGWTTATGTETVQSIDAEWERVTIEENATGKEKRFGRVKVVSGE